MIDRILTRGEGKGKHLCRTNRRKTVNKRGLGTLVFQLRDWLMEEGNPIFITNGY